MLRVRQLLFIFIGLFSTYSPILNGVVAFYPASGLRHAASGAFSYTGVNAYYWSCALPGTSAAIMYFHLAVVYPMVAWGERAYGFPVRCVQYLLYICLVLCVL